MRMGFQSILDQLKMDKSTSPVINAERELFEEETKNDYEDMRCRFQRTSIIKKISTEDGNLNVVVITDTMQTVFGVEITPDTLVGNIKYEITNQFKITKPEEYGIYSPPDPATRKKESWLNEDDNFADCGLTPEQMAQVEYRMLPWKLTVTLPNERKKIIEIDPNATCEQALSEVLLNVSLPCADYCLMLGNTILQEAKTIVRSLPNDESNRDKLILTERPLRVRVVVGEDTWQMMNFNPSKEVTLIFEEIGNHVGRNFNPENFKLVMESPDNPDSIELELGHLIREYVQSDNVIKKKKKLIFIY